MAKSGNLCLCALLLATAASAHGIWVASGDNSIRLLLDPDLGASTLTVNASGSIHAFNLKNGFKTGLSRGQLLAPGNCVKHGAGRLQSIPSGASVVQNWICTVEGTAAGVTVTDSYESASGSVSIQTSIVTDSSVPFSQAIHTGIQLSDPSPDTRLWLPWGKGCVSNSGSSQAPLCLAGHTMWSNPLVPEPLPSAPESYRYGANVGHGAKDMFSIPVTSLLQGAHGLSFGVSPEDPLLELSLESSPGGVGFTRELLRLSGNHSVTFRTHIAGHQGCWRPALSSYVSQFPSFFDSWASNAAEFEGLGSYSWNLEPYNATRARSLGFKTNWDLSGTFMPYDGLFLPYQEEWLNLGPINGGLAQYNVTYSMIDQHYAQIQAAGFHSLSYFDIGNWGTRSNFSYSGPARDCGTRPNGEPAPCPDPDGANAYLRDHLQAGLLQHGWSMYYGSFAQPKLDWVGCTDMDTMEPSFEDLVAEQLQRHLTKLAGFEGIAIDRLDYSEFFNYDADDGVSWIPQNSTNLSVWGAARALRLSYRHTFHRLHEMLHPANKTGKMMLNNCNTVCRVDEMRAFDGTFSEGAALNAVAWTGLRNPTILWTYDLAGNQTVLDAYFQQHLLMDVYPMAPMPKNDHSILPGNLVVEQAYLDYAPLFDAMHGARWLLTAHPTELGGNFSGSVNIFTAPAEGPLPQLRVPLMLGDPSAGEVLLGLNLSPAEASLGWPPVRNVQVRARYPGGAVKALGAAVLADGVWRVRVPLVRGCAMVSAVLT